MTTGVPDRTEAADYYFTYIDKVPAGDITDVLQRQASDAAAFFRAISGERSRHRYGPGKWSIREVLGHVNDTERLFVFRALWFARGLAEPLPSFDQDAALARSGADHRTWESHVDEFEAIRAGTVAFFRSLPDESWTLRGVASGNPFSVRALAFITARHLAHHLEILRDRYLA